MDKGLVTPLPPNNEEEQVEVEQEEQPKKIPTDEVSEEG